jgi:hypothetical protein
MSGFKIKEMKESTIRFTDKTMDNTPSLAMNSISINFESAGCGIRVNPGGN